MKRDENSGVCGLRGRRAGNAGVGAERRGLLQGQDRPDADRVRSRRLLRSLRPARRRTHRPLHPGQSASRVDEHGGRRESPRRQLALQRRAEGRHRDRDREPRGAVRAVARRRRRHHVRGREVHLDRQRQQRGVDLRRLGHDRRHVARSVAEHGTDHRRRRRGRRRRAVRAGDERPVRHEDQDRQRLSRRQCDQPRARARRGARPLRLVVVGHQGRAHALGDEVDDERVRAVRPRQASRPARTSRWSPTTPRPTSRSRC